METTEKEILLPQTKEELEAFIAALKEEFNLPKDEETDYSISNMIMHLPSTQAYATKTYFAHGVLRGQAQKAAFWKVEETRKVLIERDAAEKKAKEDEKAKLTLVENGNPGTTTSEQEPLQHA